MQHEDIIRDIRRRCRMAMNGIASASMRSHGLNYKLNFGVDIKKIKEIAARYESDLQLSELLWQDGTRELKILATMLCPHDACTKESACEWVRQIPNQEIREQVCINLFQSLTYADQLVSEWVVDNDYEVRTTGYWLYVRRILTKQLTQNIDISAFVYLWDDVVSPQVSLRNAALLFVKNAGKQSAAIAEDIMRNLSNYKDSEDDFLREIYDSIAFEFEFFYQG